MKNLSLKIVQTFLLCAILSLICEGCSAMPKKSKWLSYSPIEADSTLNASFGDSIINIINTASQINVTQLEIKNDSLYYINGGQLKKQDKQLLLFLVLDEEMVRKAPVNIYAKFCPMIRVDFKTKDGRCATLLFDFGLSQWSLRNVGNKEIAKGMIPTRQLLKFFYVILPQNETLSTIYKFKSKNK